MNNYILILNTRYTHSAVYYCETYYSHSYFLKRLMRSIILVSQESKTLEEYKVHSPL